MSHHTFDINIATQLGSVELAILIHHFQYWIEYNQRGKINFYEGRTWMYQTFEDLSNHFPYWSVDQVKRYVKKLIEKKILVKGNFNKTSFDRTCWYSFTDEFALCIVRNRTMENAISPNGFGDIALTIPNNKTDIENNNNTPLIPQKPDAAGAASEGVFFPSKRNKIKKEFSPRVRELASKMVEIAMKFEVTYRPPKDMTQFHTSVAEMLEEEAQDPKILMKAFEWACKDNQQQGEFNGWRGVICTNCVKGHKTNPARQLQRNLTKINARMNTRKNSKEDRRLRDNDGTDCDAWKDDLF